LVALALALTPLAGCETTEATLVDGGIGEELVIQDPPGAQIGLRYGTSVNLIVRYLMEDAEQTPVHGTVHFAIFDDPQGSTLARSDVTTDNDGRATVALTAGNAEDSFTVQASAPGAAPVEFSISVSELEFVRIDAALVDPLPMPGGRTLSALLYTNVACADLTVAETPTGESRTLVSSAAKSATLSFINLLSKQYAVVGRVTDAGRLVAYGCIDVPTALDPPGAYLSLPIPLAAVSPSVTGSFTLSTAVASTRAERSDGLFADYDVLDRCPGHLGQLVLDELATRVTPTRQMLIAAARGVAAPSTDGSSTVNCHPATVGADPSLDADLDMILSAASPGSVRGMLLADLDAILASCAMTSTLTLAPGGPLPGDGATAPTRLIASHQATTLAFTVGAQTRTDDLLLLGIPVLGASDVASSYQGSALMIGAHDLPIGLAARWGDAFDALSIAARLPTLADATPGGWSTAAVAAAQEGGASGCAAIEEVVCNITGSSGCLGTLITPCQSAVIAVAARLDAPFSDTRPLALTGTATAVDSNEDLVTDSLMPGMFTASEIVTGSLAFSGERATP
jgi:hypothetical protein